MIHVSTIGHITYVGGKRIFWLSEQENKLTSPLCRGNCIYSIQ